MIKFILILLFMVPLCFISNFWLNYFVYNILIFLVLLKLRFNYLFININFLLGCDLLGYIIVLLRC